MPTRTRRIRQGFELTLFLLFGGFRDADFVVFRDSEGNGASFA